MSGDPVNALIIGGSSGIGFACAKAMAEHCDQVYLLGRREEAVAKAAAAIGTAGVSVVADASDGTALAAALEGLEPVDHAVIAAGGPSGAGPLAELSTEELRRAFEEKFWVHWTALKALTPSLTPKGSITFVTAVRSQMAEPTSVGLAAVNGAIEAMVASLAKELAPRRVNAVAPGVIDTPPWQAMEPTAREEAFRQIGERTLVGRVGDPAEVAAAVLAVAINPYITGTILKVDGGFSL